MSTDLPRRQGPCRHADTAHHHPVVHRDPLQGWVWTCSCGGRLRRTAPARVPWRKALVGALVHSGELAA